MWLIANGAPKAGSTWLLQLLEATRHFEQVPSALQDPGWRNSSVEQTRVHEAMRTLPDQDVHYLSKQHWADRFDEVLEIPGVRMVNIVRDVRDLVISRYHHNVRVAEEQLPLEQFIARKGRKYVRDYCAYQRHWIRSPAATLTSYHVTSYEYLSFDLTAAASDVYRFAGFDLPGQQVSRHADRAAFSKKSSTGPGHFFRKGKALAFADEIGAAEANGLLGFATEFGLADIKREMASRQPNLLPYLEMTDVGVAPP